MWVILVGFSFILTNRRILIEVDLLCSSILNLNIPFIIDIYSVIFRIAVITISSCVIYYNGFYIDREVYYRRFCKLVLLFVFSILFLIIIPNLLGLIVGWDGLGITSYLLVIYYQDKRSLGSGTITVLRNRVGDVLFFVGIALCRSLSRWRFLDVDIGWLVSGLCGVIIVGCMTKRAQIPFSAWLPAAIAAPSPVSALVHSSTLVTAGVYVLIRFSGRICSGWYLFLGVVSSLTIFISAISAVFEADVKKVVALSTLRQLGVIILALSVGAVRVCFFHLVSHALFKALIFLCVGRIIHFSGIQDLRYLGGFNYSSPVIIGWLSVACLSLIGFPFLSGFFSKDLVIESFLSGGIRVVLCLIVVFSTCLTGVYSGLLIVSIITSSIRTPYIGSINSMRYITAPCTTLGVGALVGGLLIQRAVLDFNMVFRLFGVTKVIPFLCVIVGSVTMVCYYFNSFGINFKIIGIRLKDRSYEVYSDIASKIWFIPPLSSDLFSNEVLTLRGDMKSLVEDGYLEYSFGRDSVWKTSRHVSSFYINSQSDYLGLCFIKGFVFLIVVCFIFIVNRVYDKKYYGIYSFGL